MDGLTPFPEPARGRMPDAAPLARPVQRLSATMSDPNAPGWRPCRKVWTWRAAAFLPALATTAALVWAFLDLLSSGGLLAVEILLAVLVAATFFWISFAVSTATTGLIRRLGRAQTVAPDVPARALDVALLIPIYNEDPCEVFGNGCAMIEALDHKASPHRYALYFLSDTQDPDVADRELTAYAHLSALLPGSLRVLYRRRPKNTDRKAGNLADWVENWGGRHDAMLVLDADSLMSPDAIKDLTDALARDPSAGLIQSAPQLIGSGSVFGRVQQFAGCVYGGLLAHGLAAWSGREGNFWGHNAILRVRAFADTAGLPRLPTLRGPGGLILSHDFVEAALMRRAGWAVRFLPEISGSYEEPPATLIDYALRDRRWCHGNLQHLRLLFARGFHPVSRFHLFHGANSYLLSPAWFVILMIWALLGNGQNSVITYFSEANPLYPIWPEMSRVSALLVLLFMYGMLLAPKVMGALALPLTGLSVRALGGWRLFLSSLLTEIVVSILFAPILMVQQLLAVLRSAIGLKPIWAPQARKGGDYGWGTLLKFHAFETLSGAFLVVGMLTGLVSPWLAPIALSLGLAAALSRFSALRLDRIRKSRHWLATPEVLSPPDIARRAARHKGALGRMVDVPMAAE